MLIRKALAALLAVYVAVGLLTLPPWATRLSATYTHLASVSGGSGAGDHTIATMAATDFRNVDLIVVCLALYRAEGDESSATFGDNQTGNTYSSLSDVTTTNYRLRLYYSRPVDVDEFMTWTYDNANNTYPSMVVKGFSGSVASPFVDSNSTTQGSGATIATGSVTSTETLSLFIACLTNPDINGVTIDSSFTGLTTVLSSADTVHASLAYKISTGGNATENPTFGDLNAAAEADALLANFKDTGVALGNCVPFFTLLGVTFGC